MYHDVVIEADGSITLPASVTAAMGWMPNELLEVSVIDDKILLKAVSKPIRRPLP